MKISHRQHPREANSSCSASRHGKNKLVLRLSAASLASLCLQQVAGPLLANQQNAGFTHRFQKPLENLEARTLFLLFQTAIKMDEAL